MVWPCSPCEAPRLSAETRTGSCSFSQVADGEAEACCAHLGELALLVDEGDDIHRPVGNHIQCILVVSELNVQPVDALQVVLLLLQLEHVPHEELLQVLIGKVNAELLKAAEGRGPWTGGTQLLPCHSDLALPRSQLDTRLPSHGLGYNYQVQLLH